MVLYEREKLELDWRAYVALVLTFTFTHILPLLALVILCPCDT